MVTILYAIRKAKDRIKRTKHTHIYRLFQAIDDSLTQKAIKKTSTISHHADS